MNEPTRYLNEPFFNTITAQGARFVWPYPALSAITLSEETGCYQMTDEFILRVTNLRSYALTANFLNSYPQFRGDAPQLEPSPTYYSPNDINNLEALYWKVLREKVQSQRNRKKKVSKAVPRLILPSTSSENVDNVAGRLILIRRHP